MAETLYQAVAAERASFLPDDADDHGYLCLIFAGDDEPPFEDDMPDADFRSACLRAQSLMAERPASLRARLFHHDILCATLTPGS